MEFGAREVGDRRRETAVIGRQRVDLRRDEVIRPERDRKLPNTIGVPPGRPTGGGGRAGGGPPGALCRSELGVHRRARRSRGREHRRQVRERGDDDDIVVYGAHDRRGEGGSQAQHSEMHRRGVDKRAERVALLDAPLDRKPTPLKQAARGARRRVAVRPAVHAGRGTPQVDRREVVPQKRKGARYVRHSRREGHEGEGVPKVKLQQGGKRVVHELGGDLVDYPLAGVGHPHPHLQRR